MIRTDLMHRQFAGTERAPLAPLALAVMPPQRWPGPSTEPAVFDSGSVPLGYEAAPPPAPKKPARCRGDSCRQGRAECATPNRCRADNSDDGYPSRPVPLSSPIGKGEVRGTLVGWGLVALLALLALVHFAAR